MIARLAGLLAALSAAAIGLYEYDNYLEELRDEADLAASLTATGTPITAAQIHDMSESLRAAGHQIKAVSEPNDYILVVLIVVFVASFATFVWGVTRKPNLSHRS